jgi:hypothetical protein
MVVQIKLQIICTIGFLFFTEAAFAGVRDPFVPGFSMGTQGTVINGGGATGREPWTSASLCGDTSGFGFSLSGISYYSSLNALSGPDGLTQAFGGGWYARNHIVCKAAIAYLNALDVYYEQTGFLSVGTDCFRFMRLSLEATGYRTGVRIPGSVAHSVGEAGVSALVPWSWAAFSFRLEHFVIEHGNIDGGEAPLAVRFGIHTVHNRFGGQGAVVTVTPDARAPVCFTAGEEYRLTPALAFQAGFSNNPVFISFGVTLQFSGSDFGVALVNHERLGWSQGFAAAYYKKTR